MNGEPSCLHEDNEFETCGIYFRPRLITEASEQKFIEGHTHYFDHAMIVIEGEADIEGRYTDDTLALQDHIKAGDVYPVQKNIKHKITPTVLPYKHLCAFPSRLPNGKVAGENTGWEPTSY